MRTKHTTRNIILVLLAVLVANVVCTRFFFRIDLTGDNRYTLSQATRNILDNLDETVTITAYFSGDLPAEVAVAKREFRDLLTGEEVTGSGVLLPSGGFVWLICDFGKEEAKR